DRAQVLAESTGPVEVNREARNVGRGKEGKPLNVVPVGMPDEKRQLAALRLDQFHPEVADASAGVDDDLLGAVGELEAGGVAPMAGGLWGGDGDGAARAPETPV